MKIVITLVILFLLSAVFANFNRRENNPTSERGFGNYTYDRERAANRAQPRGRTAEDYAEAKEAEQQEQLEELEQEVETLRMQQAFEPKRLPPCDRRQMPLQKQLGRCE